METEYFENESVRRLLGGALDDVDFDANVVPAVLAGYDRGRRTRRFQAAGVGLAVLSVTAAAVALLPRSGPDKAGPVSAAPRPAAKKVFGDPAPCTHEQWAQLYTNGFAAMTLSADPAAEQANCRALRAAVAAVLPDATVQPSFLGVLERDSRIDQTALKGARDGGSTPELLRQTGAEQMYLAVHPDDPANLYDFSRGTITTPAGRESFQLYVDTKTGDTDYPTDCDPGKLARSVSLPIAHPDSPLTCTPIGVAGSWHGTLTSASTATGGTAKTATLTDGHGHYVRLTFNGVDTIAWYSAGAYDPDGGAGSPDHGTWINRWTGQKSATLQPPPTPALTDAEWLKLLSSPAFHGYLDGLVQYRSKLPVHHDDGK